MKFLQCNECDILLSGYYFILMGKFFCEKDYKVCKILEIFDHSIPYKTFSSPEAEEGLC